MSQYLTTAMTNHHLSLRIATTAIAIKAGNRGEGMIASKSKETIWSSNMNHSKLFKTTGSTTLIKATTPITSTKNNQPTS